MGQPGYSSSQDISLWEHFFPPFIELQHYSFGYIWELDSVFLELTLGIDSCSAVLRLIGWIWKKEKSGENKNYEDKDTN